MTETKLSRCMRVPGTAWGLPGVAMTAEAPRMAASAVTLACPTCLTTRPTTSYVNVYEVNGTFFVNAAFALELSSADCGGLPGLALWLTRIEIDVVVPNGERLTVSVPRTTDSGPVAVGTSTTIPTGIVDRIATVIGPLPAFPQGEEFRPAGEESEGLRLDAVRYYGHFQDAADANLRRIAITVPYTAQGDRSYECSGSPDLTYVADSSATLGIVACS